MLKIFGFVCCSSAPSTSSLVFSFFLPYFRFSPRANWESISFQRTRQKLCFTVWTCRFVATLLWICKLHLTLCNPDCIFQALSWTFHFSYLQLHSGYHSNLIICSLYSVQTVWKKKQHDFVSRNRELKQQKKRSVTNAANKFTICWLSMHEERQLQNLWKPSDAGGLIWLPLRLNIHTKKMCVCDSCLSDGWGGWRLWTFFALSLLHIYGKWLNCELACRLSDAASPLLALHETIEAGYHGWSNDV